MPKQKTKTKTRINKKYVILIALATIVSLLLLGIIGKLIVDNISKIQKIEQQKATLSQTLGDITTLYNNFAASNGSQEEYVRVPENRCSEISSKGPAKAYTCGTRAEVSFTKGSEQTFHSLNESLKSSISDTFSINKIYDIKEDTRDNAQTSQISLTHLSTGQRCTIYGAYYREKERYTNAPDEIQYSFHCNLNTNKKIFPLETNRL